MSIYFFIDCIVLLTTGLWVGMCSLAGYRKRDVTKSFLYLAAVLTILTLFIGLRGYFTGDSANYKVAWDLTRNASSLSQALTMRSKEYAYGILMYFLGKFTSSVSVFFCVNAAITVWGYFTVMKRYSPVMWLSILMLVCVGPLYISMNLMRNMLAAALYGLAIHYVVKKEMIHYCVCVLCITMIHTSAIVMLPLYFLLSFKWNIKKSQIGIVFLVISAAAAVIYVNLDELLKIGMRFLSAYQDYGYGVDFGLSTQSVLKAILIQFFILWNHKKLNLNDEIDCCFFNASILYCVFYILSLKIAILQRFSFYFAFSHMILIPMIISRFENKKTRTIITIGMVMFLLAYAFVANKGKEFMWYWEYGL